MSTMSMLYPRATAARRAVNLSGLWNFQFDEKGEGVSANWRNGLPAPITMPVPSSFADFFTDKAAREYTGDFWYETEVFVPSEWRGKDIFVRFGAATHRAVVYLNGVEIAKHEGGFLPFTANVGEAVKFDEANRLSVLVNNELKEECIPVGRTATLPNGKKMAKGYFDFFNYSGLQRPVWLVALPKERITDFTVTHKIDSKNAKVGYSVETTGNSAVSVTVYDEDGVKVSHADGKSGALNIANARLWEPLNAYLYKFVVRIMDGDSVIDEYIDHIGVRTVAFDGTGILINGKPVYLKGFGKHEDSDTAGRGYNPAVIKRDFELMKWVGANSFRTAHYPHSEEVYQMADRYGILVIDETPAVGLMASTLNFFDAAMGKQTAFFEKETTPQLLANHLDAVEDMIRRDKNHASVIAWSLLNEPETTDEAALPYLTKVFERARELDAQKRPCSFAVLMTATPDTCKCYQLSDFIMLNRYYGWYFLGGYELSTAEMAFHGEMAKWRDLNMNKPVIFSEYGADTSAELHKLPSVMWSQEYQTEYLEMCHRVFDAYDFVKGEQVWAFADFQTGEGSMRLDGNKKGVFTRDRQPKASAYYLKQRWEGLSAGYKGAES